VGFLAFSWAGGKLAKDLLDICVGAIWHCLHTFGRKKWAEPFNFTSPFIAPFPSASNALNI